LVDAGWRRRYAGPVKPPRLFPILSTLVFVALAACGSSGDDDDDDVIDYDAAISVPSEELICDDGIDQDEDDATDCDDSDCLIVPDVSGACTNPADLAIYRNLNGNVEWNKCVPGAPTGRGCFTDEDCNTTCVHENTGLTEDCSRCFAKLVGCFIGSCAQPCAQQPPTQACNDCVAANCVPAYSTCFGTLVCDYEFGCADTVDNDGDDLTDAADPDCQ
jgi:hypothetical protein